jgi:RimJ/RimL family protein N-acetyltransferase
MRRPQAAPFFSFPVLPPSRRLVYEPLDYHNYEVIHTLFQEDDNRFVNQEFKDKKRIGIYVVDLKEFAKYSPKKGAYDWLLYDQNTPIGILHLYDFTQEKLDGKYKRCTIGFAIGKPYRQQGFAAEAIQQGVDYIFKHFEEIEKVLAYTYPDNTASIKLLEKLEFRANTIDYMPQDRYTFFEKIKNKGEVT